MGRCPPCPPRADPRPGARRPGGRRRARPGLAGQVAACSAQRQGAVGRATGVGRRALPRGCRPGGLAVQLQLPQPRSPLQAPLGALPPAAGAGAGTSAAMRHGVAGAEVSYENVGQVQPQVTDSRCWGAAEHAGREQWRARGDSLTDVPEAGCSRAHCRFAGKGAKNAEILSADSAPSAVSAVRSDRLSAPERRRDRSEPHGTGREMGLCAKSVWQRWYTSRPPWVA